MSRGQPPKLTDPGRQEQLLALLRAGQSVAAAAKALGVARGTVYNTAKRHPVLAAAVEEALAEAKRRKASRCPTCGAPAAPAAAVYELAEKNAPLAAAS